MVNKFYISSPPNKIHISSWGSKKNPLCLFLHGWMDNSASFESVISKLKKNWFCIAPDLRGFGKSKSKQVHFWFPEYLYDLDNVVKSYNKKKINLIGHSMGANIAGLYAGINPNIINKLILIEGFGMPDRSKEDACTHYKKWLTQMNNGIQIRDFKNMESVKQNILKRAPNISQINLDKYAKKWVSYNKKTKRYEILASKYHKVINPVTYKLKDAIDCWEKIKSPCLWVYNENFIKNSFFSKNKKMFNQYKKFFNSPKEVIIKNSNHMIQLEQPDLLSNEIKKFLEN